MYLVKILNDIHQFYWLFFLIIETGVLFCQNKLLKNLGKKLLDGLTRWRTGGAKCLRLWTHVTKDIDHAFVVLQENECVKVLEIEESLL